MAEEARDNGSWALGQVAQALRGLRFGVITLVVQDGVVVQVERTERHRFASPRNGHTGRPVAALKLPETYKPEAQATGEP